MFTKKNTADIQSLETYPKFAWRHSMDGVSKNELIICKIEGSVKVLPRLYNTPYYCLEFLVRGNILMEINRQRVDIHSGSSLFIFTDYSFLVEDSSDDVELYILALSPQLAEGLGLQVSNALVARVYVHPFMELSDRNMRTILKYFDVLRDVVTEQNRDASLLLVRSLSHFIAAISASEISSPGKFSRAEELTGQFLALVDAHCREHHSIDWYASELCLTPKYVSNVVKQTLGISPGRCIGEAVIRQAKSLLASTTLPVQEIADHLGFQNQSHFGTFFRRFAGLSPTTYRKQTTTSP